MRPRGEIREALLSSAEAIAREQAQQSVEPTGLTWREMAVRAKVGLELGCTTAKNMARAGELVAVGERSEPGVNRPMRLYLPASALANSAAQANTWAAFP